MYQLDHCKPCHLDHPIFAATNLRLDQIKSWLLLFNKINNAAAIIAVHGKPDPTLPSVSPKIKFSKGWLELATQAIVDSNSGNLKNS